MISPKLSISDQERGEPLPLDGMGADQSRIKSKL
jgi:hypothetical protein